MSNANHLFQNPEPVYKPLLRQPGTITSFKIFEESLSELKFCKAKLKDLKDKEARAMELAREPFADEITLLQKQAADLSGNIELYALANTDENTKELINHISGVEIEEIHKVKIKFLKGDKKNVKD